MEDIRKALSITHARKVYVCNVATQHGETDAFSVTDHLTAIHRHVGEDLFDSILINSNMSAPIPPSAAATPVPVNGAANIQEARSRLVYADVVDPENGYLHDSKKLGEAIMRIYYGGAQVTPPIIAQPEREPAGTF